MESLGPALLLLARLIVMGPEGTHLISEYRARIPTGSAGLIKESLHEPNFPSSLAIHVTPSNPSLLSHPGEETGKTLLVLKVELWSDAGAERAGRPADEIDTETVELEAEVSRLVQIAEDAGAGRRLLLSLRTLSADDEPSVAAVPVPRSNPREVSFRVDAYRDRGGARELLSTHALRTLEGLPVSCQSSWKALAASGAIAPGPPDEELSLTLRPMLPQDGWISVEAALTARLLPRGVGTEPVLLNSSATRTVALGLPFEISVEVPGSSDSSSSPQEQPKEIFVVQITPYLSSHPLVSP
jgi:hypothetical protein